MALTTDVIYGPTNLDDFTDEELGVAYRSMIQNIAGHWRQCSIAREQYLRDHPGWEHVSTPESRQLDQAVATYQAMWVLDSHALRIANDQRRRHRATDSGTQEGP